MSVVAFLQSLLDAGLSLEDAMKAASIHEAAVHPVKERSTSAQRMARKRARDAVTSDACDVTSVTTVTSDASPLPLPPSPQTPQPPTPTPGESSSARKGRSGSTGDGGFEALWSAYPLSKGKDAARPAFAKAMARIDAEDPLAVILAGIERALPGWDLVTKAFIPHPATWLNQGRWDDEPPAPRHETHHERPDRQFPARPAHAQPSRAERDQSAALAVLARRGLLPGPDQARRVHDGPAAGLAQAG